MKLRHNVVHTLLLCFLCGAAAAQQDQLETVAPSREYVRESVLAGRDFPFLAMLLRERSIHTLLSEDAALSRITGTRWQMIAAANQDCRDDLHCRAAAVKISPPQIAEISAALRQVYEKNSQFQTFVQRELENQSAFSLSPSSKGAALLVDNWERSAAALNRIIDTYCDGEKPRYNEIDSITYDPNSLTYARLIRIVLDDLPIEETAAPVHTNEPTLFFEPSLRFALRLLQSNSRDEAGRFWPLETGQNRSAIQHLKNIRWSAFPYTVILIPGAGSEIPGISLSPWARERLRLGVEAYRSGLAPFILVSGGFVHPLHTPFCEAVEMKRYLMEVYRIPEYAILLEPYARHTTTNLRNGVREILSYGLPRQKPFLIVSDASQSSYIESGVFAKRNVEELGYQPATLGKRLSGTRQEAMPSDLSFYRDPLDPLDP